MLANCVSRNVSNVVSDGYQRPVSVRDVCRRIIDGWLGPGVAVCGRGF